MDIKYTYFPKNRKMDHDLCSIVNIFQKYQNEIGSQNKNLHSNEVLNIISTDLEKIGYKTERSKKRSDVIEIPVLLGENEKYEKSFYVDAYNKEKKIVLEVEAGRALINYQFLKDIFQASVMIDVDYLVIAVRRFYGKSEDYKKITNFIEALYASDRLKLPLKGILIIGY